MSDKRVKQTRVIPGYHLTLGIVIAMLSLIVCIEFLYCFIIVHCFEFTQLARNSKLGQIRYLIQQK